jgi:hypothetical protein
MWEVVWLMTVDWCDADMVWSSSDFTSALIPSVTDKTPSVVPIFVDDVGFLFPGYEKLAELALD